LYYFFLGASNIVAIVFIKLQGFFSGSFYTTSLSSIGNANVLIDASCPTIKMISAYDNSSVYIRYEGRSEKGSMLIAYFRTTSSCTGIPFAEVTAALNGIITIEGGESWKFPKVNVDEDAQLVFYQPDNTTYANVTIVQGVGNLNFQGTFKAFLGQPAGYVPGFSDILSGTFVVNTLNIVCSAHTPSLFHFYLFL
jgi:hypothetical protein